MPFATLERRMNVVQLGDGRLVIYSAMALDDAGMAALMALGAPAFLVVPNQFHRLDSPAWKARFPDLVVVAPQGARAEVASLVPVDTSTPAFDDGSVRFVDVAGTNERECALEIDEPEGMTLMLNDIVGNLPPSDGIVLRTLGFATTAPRIPRMAKRMFVRDARALARQLDAWAERPIRRILVSHGRPIEDDPTSALRAMARSL